MVGPDSPVGRRAAASARRWRPSSSVGQRRRLPGSHLQSGGAGSEVLPSLGRAPGGKQIQVQQQEDSDVLSQVPFHVSRKPPQQCRPLDRPVCSWSDVSDPEGTSQGDSEGIVGSGFRSAPEPLHLLGHPQHQSATHCVHLTERQVTFRVRAQDTGGDTSTQTIHPGGHMSSQ